MLIVFILNCFALFMVLYMGESTLKSNNKTLKQTIHDWIAGLTNKEDTKNER